jgi:hypothetical protein
LPKKNVETDVRSWAIRLWYEQASRLCGAGRRNRYRFAAPVARQRRSTRYPTVLMAKIFILQQLYNLAGDALEYQLLERCSFLQFLGLTESSTIPDAKTIWLFRDRLARRI